MRIFVSYSSRQRELCDRLRLALEADGRHEVFVDRSELRPGRPFDESLRRGIEQCELLLFLISPESVAPGSYARAELSVAEARWRHPSGHVLPLMAAPTPISDVPAYLRAVTILEPQGDAVAETLAAIERMKPPRRRVWPWVAALLVLAVALAGVFVLNERSRAKAQADMLAGARELCESGNAALAWQRYEEARHAHPEWSSLRMAQEDCAMRWLREIRVGPGSSFSDIVDRVLPILADAAVNASGQRAADLRAHMGWADFLRSREGASGLDPTAHYRKALSFEPSNVYANAMWGHYLMATRGSFDEAREHFALALSTSRDRPYVRRMQLSAMLWNDKPAGQAEALRVVNAMRKAGETVDAGMRERLWSYLYVDNLFYGNISDDTRLLWRDRAQPTTFRWLYPESELRPDRIRQWRFLLGMLEELSGDKSAARARFTALRDELQRQQMTGRLLDETQAALGRLALPRAADEKASAARDKQKP